MTQKEQKVRQRLADIFDCEGSLGIYHWMKSNKDGSLRHCWRFVVSVAQKRRERLVPLQKIFGGTLSQNGANHNSNHIVWTSRKAVRLIRYLLPDIEWKQEQAKMFLDAYTTWPKWDGHWGGNASFSVTVERANLANSVNALNEGGRLKVLYRVIPSQAADAVHEANDAEGVTVIHEKLNP